MRASAKRAAALAAGSLLNLAVFAGSVVGEGRSFEAPKTYQQLRYAQTVRQRLDFTCGGAALATIATNLWGRATSEEDVLVLFRIRYPDEKSWKARAETGFTFDDLEFAADALGLKAQGARVPLEQLTGLEGPVIVHLDKGKFQHFSVLRKYDGETAYLSDPFVGMVGMPAYEFERQYTGNALAVWLAGAPVPKRAPLAVVRDGIDLRSTLGRQLDRPLVQSTPTLTR